MKILITVLLTALGFVPFAWCDAEIDESASEVHCTITINISDLRNDDGQIAVLLFSSENGFPSDEDKAVMALTSFIEDGRAVLTFTDVPYGVYAVSIIHDENMNESLNKNLFGAPTEGYWISNNVRGGLFGGPGYDDASFVVSAPSVTLTACFDY